MRRKGRSTCHVRLQNKYEAQRAVLKNGMVLSGSVMIGVQPLTKQHQCLFDGSRDEDPGMKVPESKIEPPQLPTGKVGLQAVQSCCSRLCIANREA